MRVAAIEPRDRFSGLDASGWLQYPNLYHCPFCSYGVYFNQPSLDAGAYPSEVDSSALQKLKDPARSEFEAHVVPFLHANPGVFTLAFHCPKCTSPVAICFDATEVAMATL